MKSEAHTSLLARHSLKATRDRIMLLSVLSLSRRPLSVREILKRSKGVNESTLYRNLELFCEKKITSKERLLSDEYVYELVHTHHHHIVCERCGTIKGVSLCVPTPLLKKVLKQSNFRKLIRHELSFYGLCKQCAS